MLVLNVHILSYVEGMVQVRAISLNSVRITHKLELFLVHKCLSVWLIVVFKKGGEIFFEILFLLFARVTLGAVRSSIIAILSLKEFAQLLAHSPRVMGSLVFFHLVLSLLLFSFPSSLRRDHHALECLLLAQFAFHQGSVSQFVSYCIESLVDIVRDEMPLLRVVCLLWRVQIHNHVILCTEVTAYLLKLIAVSVDRVSLVVCLLLAHEDLIAELLE